jgi:anti-sigma B factor antagonist
VLTLYGELDLATIPHLEQQLELARDHDRLVIDLSALRFMDCSGLRVLLAATQHAQENEQQLHLLRGAPPIQRVFELTNTSALFTFAD